MKIVLHLTGADRGGAERQLLALLREAAARPDDMYRHVVVLIRDGELADDFAAVAPTTRLGKRGKVDLRFLYRLRQVIRDVRPAIVHAWGPTPNVWGSTVPATLRPSQRPYTLLAEVGLDEWKGPVLRFADRVAYMAADRVVGCANAVTRTAVERGAPRHKTGTVLLGVDVPPRRQRRPEQGLVLLLARMDWRKGHRALLRSWPAVVEAVPHARLIMAGPAVAQEEMSLREDVQALVAAHPVLQKTVEVLGAVDPDTYLNRAEVLVVPSSSEGLPNVILEALSQEVAVVAHDVGGISEVISTETGWLVSAGDGDALAEALTDALTNLQEARSRAARGRTKVEEMTFAHSLANWMQVYDELSEPRPVEHGAVGHGRADF